MQSVPEEEQLHSQAWPSSSALRRSQAFRALILAGLLSSPDLAFAHGRPIPGLEGFYTGMAHPLSTPPQLLALLALGLLLGQGWPQTFIIAWRAFALTAIGGLILGTVGYGHSLGERALLVIALAASSLAAIAPAWIIIPGTLLAGAGGLFLGMVSTPDPGPLGATIIMITGAYIGANLALFYTSGGIGWLRDRFNKPWAVIGLRIIAAWVAAISCLMFALNVVSGVL
jgi:hydrogenase/urease accessory protein HupE